MSVIPQTSSYGYTIVIAKKPNTRQIKRITEMIGDKYGRWTVLEENVTHTNKNKNHHFLCRCDCGEVRILDKNNLVNGKTRSCGCLKRELRKNDLSGKVFGILTVLYEVGLNKHNAFLWKCLCKCGNEVVYSSNMLNVGDAKSCGCTKQADLIGERFGKLTVTSKKGIENTQVVWLCKCDCGNETTATTNMLNSEGKISCGCARINGEVVRSEKRRVRARINCHIRRCRVLNSNGSHTHIQIQELLVKQKHKCANCKSNIKKCYEIDHIIPISKLGDNDIYNIQLLCRPCNVRKNNTDPIVFAQRQGRLL